MSNFMLSAEEREAIQHERSHYENPRAASIEALKIVQQRRGWVSDDAIKAIAPLLNMSPAELDEVATFYSLIFRLPVGKHVIKVCDSVSCYLTGYEQLKSALEQKLGVRCGQTTPDDRFTLLPICCLGACDKGPCLMVDDDLHGPLTPSGIDAMLERYP
ncbi:MAG: NADH-quinone oxidoreductase subunit NuoE [Nevskiales bacterium]